MVDIYKSKGNVDVIATESVVAAEFARCIRRACGSCGVGIDEAAAAVLAVIPCVNKLAKPVLLSMFGRAEVGWCRGCKSIVVRWRHSILCVTAAHVHGRRPRVPNIFRDLRMHREF